jgi:hypothetical protein
MPWIKASSRRARPALLAAVAAGIACAAAWPAAAADPRSLFGGRLRLAGELSGTFAPEDEGYFNYSDYQTSTLRLFRLDLAAEARLARWAFVLADVRSDNLGSPRVYALYLRVRPWASRELDLQAGLVPPVFGAFPRRRYASENPLPSVPLAYQYLTTMRYDAVPSRAEDVVAQRGRGWLVHYPVGAADAEPGLPLVNGERWDTGAQLRVGRGPLALALALTQGSPSDPRVRDDNGGKQVSGRLAWTPGPALSVGLSGATAPFLSRDVQRAFADRATGDYPQQAAGLDAEWSRGRWIVRAEAVYTRWRLPVLDATPIERPLSALGLYAEARCKLRPGLYVAARVERLDFARLASALGEQTWDAPVSRIEAGGGYSPWRHATLKLSWQHNERDGGRVRANDLVAGQVLLWF